MSRHDCHSPHRQGPHELRLWAIVDSLVTDVSEKEAYLAFARELMMAERHGRPPDSPEFRVQKPESRIGGPADEAVKRIVEKWFRRGLSGHLMWLIGEAMLRGTG
jgi:hypothetical protein